MNNMTSFLRGVRYIADFIKISRPWLRTSGFLPNFLHNATWSLPHVEIATCLDTNNY